MITAQQIIATLGLQPHPREGVYFVEGYRSEESIFGEALPGRYSGPRSISTAIYYLLTPDAFSEMHRLRSDEVFHFYLGDPMEMLQLRPDGTGEVVMLGTDIVGGMRPQVVVQQLREPHPRAGQGVGNDWLSLPRGRARRDGAIRDQQRARSRACQHDRTGQKRGHIEPEPV